MTTTPLRAASNSASVIRSKIIEWDAAKGYGFVAHQGKPLFIHRRDFVKRSHLPRKGDPVSFVLGVDQKGRACAKAVECSVTRRNRLTLRDWLVLIVFLTAPALALLKLPFSPWIPLAYVSLVSGLNYWDYAADKHRAQQGFRRVPESSLLFLGLIGGWPGGFLAQRHFRHKTVKASFRRAFWRIVLLHQAIALDFLCDWAGSRQLWSWALEMRTMISDW